MSTTSDARKRRYDSEHLQRAFDGQQCRDAYLQAYEDDSDQQRPTVDFQPGESHPQWRFWARERIRTLEAQVEQLKGEVTMADDEKDACHRAHGELADRVVAAEEAHTKDTACPKCGRVSAPERERRLWNARAHVVDLRHEVAGVRWELGELLQQRDRAEDELRGRCRCGTPFAQDGKGCQWHTAVQADAIRRALAALSVADGLNESGEPS